MPANRSLMEALEARWLLSGALDGSPVEVVTGPPAMVLDFDRVLAAPVVGYGGAERHLRAADALATGVWFVGSPPDVATYPSAGNDVVTTVEDASVAFDVLANDSDADGDALTITGYTAPAHGSVSRDGGTFTYSPHGNFCGSDSFTYTVSDSHGGSDTASVLLTVEAQNDAPTLTAISVLSGATSGQPFTISYSALAAAANEADVDGGAISFRIESLGEGVTTKSGSAVGVGTLLSSGQSFSWLPTFTAGRIATAFAVRAYDGAMMSAEPIDVRVDVEGLVPPPPPGLGNANPVAIDDTVTLSEDTTRVIHVMANDSDPDGDAINVSSWTAPAHGTLSLSGGAFTYAPVANYHGTDSFTYHLSDARGGLAVGMVNLTILPVNDPPTLTAISTLSGATAGQPMTISYSALAASANEADIDGDALSFRVEAVLNGTLTKGGQAVVPGVTRVASGESLAWTSSAGASGTVSAFTVVAFDGVAASSGAVAVKVSVAPPGDTTPPKVTGWTINGGSAQRSRLETLRITFSESVGASLGASDLRVLGAGGAAVSLAGVTFRYDVAGKYGEWDFSNVTLTDGDYTLRLLAGGVSDAAGNQLNGNGNGVGGDDWSAGTYQLTGDVDGDGQVGLGDLSLIASNWGRAGSIDDGDLDGSGTVELADLSLLATGWGGVA